LILYELLEKTGFRPLARKLYRVELRGTENIPARGGVILVANHESLFDPWLLALATRRPVRYMAKSELWRYAPVGRALEAFGAFPVERGAGDATAISNAAELLRRGQVLGIFPQGTSKRLESRPFFRLSIRAVVPPSAGETRYDRDDDDAMVGRPFSVRAPPGPGGGQPRPALRHAVPRRT